MKAMNGWDVFLKIKELISEEGNNELHIDHLVNGLGIKKEHAREYLVALATLEFISFTDKSKDVFVITEMGRH